MEKSDVYVKTLIRKVDSSIDNPPLYELQAKYLKNNSILNALKKGQNRPL